MADFRRRAGGAVLDASDRPRISPDGRQQALPRVGHRWVKRATIAAVILLALCLFLVGLDCLVAGPTGGCAVTVGQAAIVTGAFLVSVVVQMLGNSRVRQVSGRH